MGFARPVADRVIFMDYRQIVESNTPDVPLKTRSTSTPGSSSPDLSNVLPTGRSKNDGADRH
jgi:hypothetical protein